MPISVWIRLLGCRGEGESHDFSEKILSVPDLKEGSCAVLSPLFPKFAQFRNASDDIALLLAA